MKQRRYMMLGLVVVFSLMTFAHAVGEQTIVQTIVLEAGPAGKGAHGEVAIKNNGQDQKEITINATGLKPRSVYTVWLVNVKPSLVPFLKPKMETAGVGSGDYSFRSDETGTGQYTATISTTELERWHLLKIAHHPDGDPTNMKNTGGALQAHLK